MPKSPDRTDAAAPEPLNPVADRPIGIFDSGVGGLTVARAVIDQLPNESILYVGDTANGPYGPLPIAEVRANALGVMDELVNSGVKLLVIACNSASAAVLRDARERYTARFGIPVIEVIQPAVRRAVAATRTGNVGVIGTVATVGSRAYEDTFAAAPNLSITSAACPDFVRFVESGITAGPELLSTAQEYLAPLKAANVDTLVLGCTHYPLLTGVISYVMGDSVTLVSSAEETAKDVYRALVSHDLERVSTAAPTHEFLSTGDAASFGHLARRFLGPEVRGVSQVTHVAAHYPTGSLARITEDMLAAAREAAPGPAASRVSNFVLSGSAGRLAAPGWGAGETA
ncbi:glutamate racemase [Arthrobacter stackebrandtii]|uniref:Glutamate racemase n=1 Tax=Arthrobacter stackebrandtii TaxID=272161 RepID=A0ABS4YYQ7_9MICC|nr:glutamate racemase [Arthrobacter stackebrandtii]MBP2413918.1 glutamate racemase [Arthrobacter stackebrandtii]PYH00483.1 glutamate racemase [Arthrobacter stackebrandtii]